VCMLQSVALLVAGGAGEVCACCSVLQCWLQVELVKCVHVAVCCSVGSSVQQCVAVCCSVLQCVAVCCSVLQSVAVCCSVGCSVLHQVDLVCVCVCV